MDAMAIIVITIDNERTCTRLMNETLFFFFLRVVRLWCRESIAVVVVSRSGRHFGCGHGNRCFKKQTILEWERQRAYLNCKTQKVKGERIACSPKYW